MFHGQGEPVPAKCWHSDALGSVSCPFSWAFVVLLSSWASGRGGRSGGKGGGGFIFPKAGNVRSCQDDFFPPVDFTAYDL